MIYDNAFIMRNSMGNNNKLFV